MSRYALVMIDMQNGFINPASPLCIPMAAATVPACAETIALCRASGVPVVFATRRYRADMARIGARIMTSEELKTELRRG